MRRGVSGLNTMPVLVAAALLAIASTSMAQNATGGRPLYVVMTGAQEAPGPGDPDGTGTASFTLNQGQGQICYELGAANIDPATAAHIHRAPAGAPGPVVVPLAPPTSGTSAGCATVDKELIKAIRQNPENYYVNVHNPAYPAGAIRAQLSK